MDFYTRLYNTLENLRKTCAISHTEWADLLGMTLPQYEKIYVHRQPLDSAYVERLQGHFNFTLERLLIEDLDVAAAAAHYHGDLAHMPERYTIGAFSKKRTAASIMKYLRKNYDMDHCLQVARRLQLTPWSLSKPDESVNIVLITDILHALKLYFRDPRHFMELGAESVESNKSSPLGQVLAKCRSPKEVYEKMILDLVGLYEKNCSYKITDSNITSITVESVSNPDVCDLLKLRNLGSPEGCLMRAGILAATPEYIGLARARVQHTKCVFRQDPACVFVVDFEESHRASRGNDYAALRNGTPGAPIAMRSFQSFRKASASLRA